MQLRIHGRASNVTAESSVGGVLKAFRARAVTGAALMSLVALAGCSSNMPVGSDAAGSDSNAAGKGAGVSESENKSVEEYNLKFAACMREAGVNVPDDLQNYGPGEDFGVDANAWNTAVQGCWEKVGDSPTAGADSEMTDQEFDRLVRVAQCLRQDGYHVEDPVRGQGIRLNDVPPAAISQCFDKADAANASNTGTENTK